MQETTKKSFAVIVEKKPFVQPGTQPTAVFTPASNYCRNTILDVPGNLQINGNTGSFELKINNQSNYRSTIRISIKNGLADPSLISVPKKTVISETIFVRADSEETKITYSVENPECNFVKTTIVNSIQKPENSASISAIVQDTNTEAYEIIVSLQNKSGQKISGNIGINLPGEWAIEGNREIELNAFESKQAKIRLVPKQPLAQKTIGQVSFTSNDETISVPLELEPKKGSFNAIIGTMFALLGNSLWFGLLSLFIIIVIALFLLAFYSRTPKRHIIIRTTSTEVKA